MRSQSERVYENFRYRVMRTDSTDQWRLAAFVQDEVGQETPLPSQGILLNSIHHMNPTIQTAAGSAKWRSEQSRATS